MTPVRSLPSFLFPHRNRQTNTIAEISRMHRHNVVVIPTHSGDMIPYAFSSALPVAQICSQLSTQLRICS